MQEYSTRAKRTALGAEAPGFNVKNIYGTPVSLDSFPKKYLLLAFTAPWCDMCQTEDLYLDEVAMKYPKEKVDMLLVSLDGKSLQRIASAGTWLPIPPDRQPCWLICIT